MFEYIREMRDEWLAIAAQGDPRLSDESRVNRAAAAARAEQARRAALKGASR